LANDLPTDPEDPRLKGWYHTIELGDGLVTRGVFDHRPVVDLYGLPPSLEGRTVLDVGTGDGFFAFEMERRGAERVVAVDVPNLWECDWLPRMRARTGEAMKKNDSWPTHFRMAQAMRGSQVEYKHCSVYELSPDELGLFDLVFCGSLLLHLQNPLQALCRIRSVTRGMAIIETAIDAALENAHPDQPYVHFGSPGPEKEMGEDNVFWFTTTRALRRMLEYADFPRTQPRGVFDLSATGPRVTSVRAYVDESVYETDTVSNDADATSTAESTMEELSGNPRAAQQEIERMRREVVEAQTDAGTSREELEALRRSISWRVTAPLRWVRQRTGGASIPWHGTDQDR
jgi:tRNA (mo5U34)-methyltransferase